MRHDQRLRGDSPAGGADELRLELWVQPGLATHGDLKGIVERLRELEVSGTVDDASVETLERFVDLSLDADEVTRRICRRIGGFAADPESRGERPAAGEVVRFGVGRLGPERVAWRTPPALLVERRDGETVAVTPSRETARSIRRRLDELACDRSDRSDGRDAGRPRDRDVDPRPDVTASRVTGGRRTHRGRRLPRRRRSVVP